MRAVALLSGGLDSTLAIRMILDQAVEVEALNFVSVFCTCTPKNSPCSVARSAVRQLGIGLKAVNTSGEFLEIVKKPKHGYGRNLNPCLDCRILMFRKAREYMHEIGASFLVTGEVLGERPMSQRREAMKLIEREATVEGLVVRPLSAALLEPSIPEKKGWIDRSKLLNITGRSRKPQIQLAQNFGITDYPCPAGGCRLTDPVFTKRMRDLMKYTPGFTLHDAILLKAGRHFRLSPSAKAIVGRNEDENKRLLALSKEEDTLVEAVDFPGPLTVVRGQAGHEKLRLSAAITAGYGKARHLTRVKVALWDKKGTRRTEVYVAPADEEAMAKIRIGNGRPQRKKQECATET
ncbi:hypothetical protein HQ563_04925 [bacterium]|nr:hypothetical protein [bacterium]